VKSRQLGQFGVGGLTQLTANHGYEVCWSDQMQTDGQFRTAFQLVFQPKTKTDINYINQ